MNPSTENTTNPANMDVAQFNTGMNIASFTVLFLNLLKDPSVIKDPHPIPDEKIICEAAAAHTCGMMLNYTYFTATI